MKLKNISLSLNEKGTVLNINHIQWWWDNNVIRSYASYFSPEIFVAIIEFLLSTGNQRKQMQS